jgi:hypothetical protein
MAKIKIKDIFDKNGNFINPIDPYRCDRDNEIYQYLFDEDGYALRNEETRKFILKHNCSPFSAIVHYYYSHDIDCGCKGNYTAVYAWR